MSMVQQAIEVGAPLHTVYEQLATFENYPRFMSGVRQVTPIGEDRTHWVMDLDGERREFDAQIIERTLDQRVSWSTTDGPLLAETITLRPMGETRTQVVAQLEADAAFLLPGGRHSADALHRRLADDLTTFKGLVESGVMGPLTGAGPKRLKRPDAVPGTTATRTGPVSPATVAARIKRRADAPHPGAGWGPGRGPTDDAAMGTRVDITTAPGIDSATDLDDVLAPGRRIVGGTGAQSGSAPMGAHAQRTEDRGDAMIHEEDRGSAHDY
ncbi:SRPBCC family protein [Jidongwangia harbinensis]|uniref:SRPBCC family protein n=1 Tax=Jidongwangia harbinensis TaxID=2878561 RepID=UPI001CD99F10|nr:SRPBCC family protein [Jidongwangia harbinensis]MCA2213729.1 SRPBCC family protein [Jidongwangia harbinensis]